MGSTITIAAYTMIMDLVNSTNILTIFIALFVVFFLLGLLIGLSIGGRRNGRLRDRRSAAQTDLSNQINPPTQENRMNMDRQPYDPTHRHTHSRHRNHNRHSVRGL